MKSRLAHVLLSTSLATGSALAEPAHCPALDAAEKLATARSFAEARAAFAAAEAACPAALAGRARARAGLMQGQMRDFEGARATLESAAELAEAANDVALSGTVQRYLGRVAFEEGELSLARGHNWEALALHRRAGTPADLLGDMLGIAADEYYSAPNLALGIYLEAIELAAEAGESKSESLALQGAAAVLLRFGELSWSESLLSQAAAIARRLGDARLAASAGTYRVSLLGVLDDCAGVLGTGMPLLLESRLEPEKQRAIRVEVAECQLESRDWDAALQTILPALPAPGDLAPRGGFSESVAEALILAARIQRMRGELQLGANALQRAVAMTLKTVEVQGLLSAERAAFARAMGDLPEALRHARAAVRALDALRLKAGGTADTFFGDDNLKELRALFDLEMSAGHVGDAFLAAQVMKAAALSDRYRKDSLPGAAALARAGVGLLTDLADSPAGPVRFLGGLQHGLPPGTALLDYYLVGGRLYCFLISPRAVSVTVITDVGAVDRDVAALSRALKRREPLTGPAARLGALLLAPAAGALLSGEIQRLAVSPHGALHGVPFEVLTLSDRPLIELTDVSYLPSVSMLPVDGSKVPITIWTESSALVVGDPDGTLPGAGREARDVSSRFKASDLFLRDMATRRAFLSRAAGADVLHLSTHAQQSGPTSGAWLKLADGLLYPWEIRRLRLKAGLVVLSACESGVAPVESGDEMPEALDRAFLAAGARAVIGTRWPVRDSVAEAFGEVFYRRLPELGPAGAVAAAAREIRSGAARRAHRTAETLVTVADLDRGLLPVYASERRSQFGDPTDWAAFKLTGADW